MTVRPVLATMRRLAPLCLAPLLLLTGRAWTGEVKNEIQSDADSEQRFVSDRREAAASFRVARAEARPNLPPSYHRQAEEELALVQTAAASGQLDQAADRATEAYSRWPYSDAAPALAHAALRATAATGRTALARRWLIDLWERHPEYQGIGVAMREVAIVAETLQSTYATIDLDAEDPQMAVRADSLLRALAADDLFRFLARHGDRADVAPRAALGLARSLMIEGGKDKLAEARIAYDDFLARYPEHDLVHTALMELALCHLLGYKGPNFDVGALKKAADIIDQAELYAREIPERVARVSRYRAMIRRWHQERDAVAAAWYRRRGYPEPARFYYEEVVARDPASEVATAAQRAMSELPPEPAPDAP